MSAAAHDAKAPGSRGPDAGSGLRVARAGATVVLTMDRPHARNAIDLSIAKAIGDAVRAASADSSVRAVVLTGAGPQFSAGGDLAEISALAAKHPGVDGARQVMAMFDDHLSAIEACDVPVIAAVQGDAFGGACELVLLCDSVVIDEAAHLVFRHATMGLSPAWGGMERLVERAGSLHAAHLLFTGEKVDGHRAVALNLAYMASEAGKALDLALIVARQMTQSPRDSVAHLKRTLQAVRAARRGAAPEVERRAFEARWGSPDHLTAMQSFRSKKKS